MTDIERIKRKIMSLNTKGMSCIQTNPEEALKCFRRALQIASKARIDGKLRAGLLNAMGIAYVMKESYDDSIRCLEKSKKIKLRVNDKKGLINTLFNLSKAYRAVCKYDKSLGLLRWMLELSLELGDHDATKHAEREIEITEKTKRKEPLRIPPRDIGLMDSKRIFESVFDSEYLPNFLDGLHCVIEDISFKIINRNNASVMAIFRVQDHDADFADPYSSDRWKTERPRILHPRMEGATPNLVVFYDRNMRLGQSFVTNGQSRSVDFHSIEKKWNIFIPSSYPEWGLLPAPICEEHKYFTGKGQVLFWKLDNRLKYKVVLTIRKAQLEPHEEPSTFKLGLLFPYEKVQFLTCSVKPPRNGLFYKGTLLRIPYSRSKPPGIVEREFLDQTNPTFRYKITGETMGTLKDVGPAMGVELDDYHVLGFEFSYFDIVGIVMRALVSTPSKAEDTMFFKDKSHDWLLEVTGQLLWRRLREFRSSITLTNEIIQSLRDSGVDMIVQSVPRHEIKIGIQIKSYSDISKSNFTKEIKAQITDSKKHKLQLLAIILCGDLTDEGQSEKIRGFISEVSQMGDESLFVVSPDSYLSVLRGNALLN